MGKIMLGVDKLFGPGHTFVDPFEKHVEDIVCELDVSLGDLIVEQQSLFMKTIDVRLKEIDLHGIESLQEHFEEAIGDLVVELVLREMLLLQVERDQLGDLLIDRRGSYRIGRSPERCSRNEKPRQKNGG